MLLSPSACSFADDVLGSSLRSLQTRHRTQHDNSSVLSPCRRQCSRRRYHPLSCKLTGKPSAPSTRRPAMSTGDNVLCRLSDCNDELDPLDDKTRRHMTRPATLPTVISRRMRTKKLLSSKYSASWKRQYYTIEDTPLDTVQCSCRYSSSLSPSLLFEDIPSSPIVGSDFTTSYPACCGNLWYSRGETFLFGLTNPTLSGLEPTLHSLTAPAEPDTSLVDEPAAVACFQRAAELGHAKAITMLGFCYEFELGVPQNFKTAESYYLVAGNAPHLEPLSMARLSFLRRYGRPYVRMDRTEADLWCARLRERYLPPTTTTSSPTTTENKCNKKSCIDISATTLLNHDTNELISKSIITPGENDEDPLAWLRWAAGVVRHSAAQYALGTCYHDGVGLPTADPEMAVYWYSRSAAQGHPRGEGILGYCYGEAFGVKRNLTFALHWYMLAAAKGETVAMYNVGYCYEESVGVSKDYRVAFEWYRQAAQRGNALAANSLGYFYEEGLGVQRDFVKAVHWYQLSAEQGNPWGEHNLAYMYAAGLGVKADPVKAVYWYRKSAEQGHAGAQNKLAFYLQTGEGTVPNPIASVYWYIKAANQGYASACINLAWCLERGIGCNRNIQQAMHWIEYAITKYQENATTSSSASSGQEEATLRDWLTTTSMRFCMERLIEEVGEEQYAAGIIGAATAA